MSVARARQYRKHLTEQEVRMWAALRELRAHGLHFRRQAPLDGYVLDFVCHRAKLIVEIDGVQHAVGKQLQRDQERDAYFARSGYLTLRYWNGEIAADLDSVADGIFQIAVERLSARPPPPPCGRTLPARGRDEPLRGWRKCFQ